MKNKYIVIAIAMIVLIGLVVWWMNVSEESPVNESGVSEKLSVVTTLFPLYDFAKSIGGEYVDVSLLLPPGVESHSFEPKPSDMVRIDQSDIFVYTGKAMEPWAEDLRKGIRSSVSVVDASQGIELLEESAEAEHSDHEEGDAHEEHEEEHGHAHGGMDPHIWLDFDNAAKMVSNIEKVFLERDPAHSETYRKNAENYRKQLSDLDRRYVAELASCSNKKIVYGGHYAFGYLAHRYGLEYTAAQGLAPDAEPSTKDIVGLVNQVRENNIRAIFYEELSSPKIAETLASETGAKMLLLNAAHNIGKDDSLKGVTFLGIMDENLVNLREGLGC